MKKEYSSFYKQTKGSSLLEMLVYIAILSLLVSVIVALLSGIINSEKRFIASKNIQTSAITALDRITREIRQANDVDLAGSILSTSPGILKLNSTDDIGNNKTIIFRVNEGVMHIVENNIDQGPMTSQNVLVTNLIFNLITTAASEAVKVQITMRSGKGEALRSETFYSTIILRGSY